MKTMPQHQTPAGTVPADAPSPYRYRRRIQWGDADPALIAYTARFLDFVMDAVDSWFRDVVGLDWYRMNVEHGVGSPVVHVDMDFRTPLRPGDELLLEVRVEDLGTSSLRLGFTGNLAGGAPVYAGNLVLVFIERATVRSTPIPPFIREPIEHYRRACAGGDEHDQG